MANAAATGRSRGSNHYGSLGSRSRWNGCYFRHGLLAAALYIRGAGTFATGG